FETYFLYDTIIFWFFFFFSSRRRHTRFSRDWSSDVCSSDLGTTGKLRTGGDGANMQAQGEPPTEKLVAFFSGVVELDAEGKAIRSEERRVGKECRSRWSREN